MAFTSPELVRVHLNDLQSGEVEVAEFALVLSGATPGQLSHAGLVEESVVVKCRRSTGLSRESKAVQDSWIGLSQSRLVPGSVLVGFDSSLGVVYHENIDYVVDHVGGRLKRIPSGAIALGQSVSVWYDHYFVYTEGDDYTVTETTGLVTRKPSGSIADGQTVLVDYTVALGTFSDAVINQAIDAAGEAVLALVDARYHESSVPGIVLGETHWAVAAACRIRAASSLADATISSAAARSAGAMWLQLAEQYDRSGRDHLSRFAAPVSSLRTGGMA